MDLKNRVVEKYLELVTSMGTYEKEKINKNKPNHFHPTLHNQQ